MPIYKFTSNKISLPVGRNNLTNCAEYKRTEAKPAVGDTGKWVVEKQEYSGKDRLFVKSRKLSFGSMLFPGEKNGISGFVVDFGFKFDKKRYKTILVVDNILLNSYPMPKGTDPLKLNTSASVVTGNKIGFAIGATNVIDWKGQSWSIIISINATYNMLNGKYSIEIQQYTPATIK